MSIPDIEEQWRDCETFDLQLAPSSDSRHLWGFFDFTMMAGYMRSDPLPPGQTVHTVDHLSFSWKGVETEGPITYGRDNRFIIDFQDDRLQGTFDSDLCQNAKFTAIQTSRVPVPEEVREDWKQEYRSHNQSRYDAESSSRWGGWGGESVPDKAQESDSDYGQDQSGQEDDSYDDRYDDVFSMAY